MAQTSLPPGFRFYPTDVELVSYYLKRKIMGKKLIVDAISEVELYKFPPWDLPDKSCLRSRDLEWFFFCPRDKKYANGSRTNRATPNGYWKTSGKDRTIMLNSRIVGSKKTLIFHEGKAPKGDRTDWVMYEYKMEDDSLVSAGFSKDAYVLCKIFKKSGLGPRIGEQYGAPFNEDEWENAEAETSMFHLMPSSEVVNPVEQPHIQEAPPAGTMEKPIFQDSYAACATEDSSFDAAANTRFDGMSFVDAVPGSDIQDGVVTENNISDEVHDLCDPPEFDGLLLEELSKFLTDSPVRDNALGENSVLPPMSEAEAYAFEMNTMDLYNELSGFAGFRDVTYSNTGDDGPMEHSHTALPADRQLSTDEFLELNDLLAPDTSFPCECPAELNRYLQYPLAQYTNENHNDVRAPQISFESGVMHPTMPSIFEVFPPDNIGFAPDQATYLSDPSMQYPFP